MDILNNNINQAVINAINNLFLTNSLAQSVVKNISSTEPLQIKNLNKKDEPYHYNKRNLNSKELAKYKKATLASVEDNIDDDNEEEE